MKLKKLGIFAGLLASIFLCNYALPLPTATTTLNPQVDKPASASREKWTKVLKIGGITAFLAAGASLLFAPASVCAATGVCVVGSGVTGASTAVTTAAAHAAPVVAAAKHAGVAIMGWLVVDGVSHIRSNPLMPCLVPLMHGGGWPAAVCNDSNRGFILLLPSGRPASWLCPTLEQKLFHVSEVLLLRTDLGFACVTTSDGTLIKVGYAFLTALVAVGAAISRWG